jgi:hypothetical protein
MRMQTKGAIGVLTLGLAVLAAVAFIGASSGDLAEDPCDGHYVGQGLKAIFSDSYNDGGVAYESSLVNDIPGFSYQYAVPGGDCVFYFRNGHVVVRADRTKNGRFVNMRFFGEQNVPTGTLCAPNPYFLDPGVVEGTWPRWFYFRTAGGYAWTRDGQGKLVMTGTGVNLDFMAMTPGQVGYCDTWLHFGVMNDDNTAYDESSDEYWLSGDPVQVTYGPVAGVLKWIIRPIAEPYTVRALTKVKKQVIVTETSFSNSLFRTMISNMRSTCFHGAYYFPFELVLERLN